MDSYMLYTLILSLVYILLIIQCQVSASQPQNGDVRLNYVNDNFYNSEGVLEIYISDIHIWIPVCFHKDFNKGTAITACKQMGYSTISTAQHDEGFTVQTKPYV